MSRETLKKSKLNFYYENILQANRGNTFRLSTEGGGANSGSAFAGFTWLG